MAEGRTAMAALREIGYIKHPDNDDAWDWNVYDKHDGDVEAVHLHMVPIDGRRWREYLDFRDYLRSHAKAARAYSDLKIALAAEFVRDRIGYAEAKDDFVYELLQKARSGPSGV
jgi:GrpB-like predicted nucleotidyltransferase (UPF0157 family)